MLLSEFLKDGVASLESLYPTAEAKAVVLQLCSEILGTKNYTHIIEPQYQIDKKKVQPLAEAMVRLQAGEPIQYVVGKTEFCGHIFKVDKNVLVPRPETELLVREAVKLAARIKQRRIPYGRSAEPVRILDLCTGSGNIAWTVALGVPGARVVGVDNSEGALDVARSQNFSSEMKATGAQAPTFVNADVLETEQEFQAPTFVNADVLETEQEFNFGEFDLILSNPPYVMESERSQIRKNVLDYEPASALFVPDEDPLKFYRAIARWSDRFLAAEGKGLTEINEVLGKETEAVFKEAGFAQTDIVKDFYDKNRFIFYTK